MFHLNRPTPARLKQFRTGFLKGDYSYPEVGMTWQDTRTPGYIEDHHRVLLGYGAETFRRGCAELRRWTNFQLGWLEPCWPEQSLEESQGVGLLVRYAGLWMVVGCNIVGIRERSNDRQTSLAYAYGTPQGHPETGEERFTIEWNHDDDSVWYDIRALSRPGLWLTWLGFPFVRRLQKRFARDSMRVMKAAVAETTCRVEQGTL